MIKPIALQQIRAKRLKLFTLHDIESDGLLLFKLGIGLLDPGILLFKLHEPGIQLFKLGKLGL